MGSKEDQVLRAAKEVAVKFIEVGRISPSNFPELFKSIYDAIDQAVGKKPDHDPSPSPAKKKKA